MVTGGCFETPVYHSEGLHERDGEGEPKRVGTLGGFPGVAFRRRETQD